DRSGGRRIHDVVDLEQRNTAARPPCAAGRSGRGRRRERLVEGGLGYQRWTRCDRNAPTSFFERLSVTASDSSDATAPIGSVTSRGPHRWPRSITKCVMWSVSSTRNPSTSPR